MKNKTNFWVYNASAGSGKTYTLVREYLKIILQKPESYKRILAMTFTNKAANELKIRILEALHGEEKDDFYKSFGGELSETKKHFKAVLNKILEDYSNFNITTLDAFTHKIVRSFAKDLQIPSQFEVVLDPQELINKSVENLIAKIGTTEYITKILTNFALYKTSEDKYWDIAVELREIAKILLQEDDFEQIKKLQHYDFEHFPLKKIQQQNQIFKKNFTKIAEKAFKVIEQEELTKKDFYYGDFFNFLNYVKNCDFEKLNFGGRLEKNINEGKICKNSKINTENEKFFIKIYTEIKNLYSEKYKHFYLRTELEKYWVPLAILQEIKKEMDLLKMENSVQLNAEFNKIIREKIKNLPSPFIYERLSQWISYFFIDEMQDTSLLQWENLIPLIKDSLDANPNAKLFLVGDAKQSIYRWRGGHPEQFINLTKDENPFFSSKKIENLPKNYRSYSEIVKFNNAFFSFVAEDFENENHKNLYKNGNDQKCNENKKGGYVSLEFLNFENISKEEKETVLYPEKIAEKIEQITNLGYKKNAICVLVRKRKHGNFVADYLAKRNIKVTSSETLLIKNSAEVCFLEAFLKVFENSEDKKSQFFILQYLYEKDENLKKQSAAHDFYKENLRTHAKHFLYNLRAFSKKPLPKNFWELPLYEQVTALVNSFELVKKSDAYVENFLELVLTFQKKGGGVAKFLSHWAQIKDSESIIAPQDEDSVQIMTVHKSKGLEFPVVIFAYDLEITRDLGSYFWYENREMLADYGLRNFRLPQKKANHILGTDAEKNYEKHKQELIFDAINILYVALTRAEQQLHIITEKKLNTKKTTFSGKFIGFLEHKNIWNPSKKFL